MQVCHKSLRGVVFDLDGTLIDSLEDIADNVNFCLAKHGYPTHSYNDYRQFIGDGVQTLVSRVAPGLTQEQYAALFASVKERYRDCCVVKTALYPGIRELLIELRRRGLKLAILTNKPHEITLGTLQIVADVSWFDFIVGARSDLPRKPDPAGLKLVCKEIGLQTQEVAMVGDSAADMLTGKAAGSLTVGVLWGLRDEAEIRGAGAQHVIRQPAELLNLL